MNIQEKRIVYLNSVEAAALEGAVKFSLEELNSSLKQLPEEFSKTISEHIDLLRSLDKKMSLLFRE